MRPSALFGFWGVSTILGCFLQNRESIGRTVAPTVLRLRGYVAIFHHTDATPPHVFQIATDARMMGTSMSRTHRLKKRARSLQDSRSNLTTNEDQWARSGLNSSVSDVACFWI